MMLRFKKFLQESLLVEYLTDAQRARYSDVQMTPEARKATDHFFGRGNDHVKEEVLDFTPQKSEVHKAIERHLGKEISHDEYTKGLTRDQHGREARLGRMIRDEHLRNQFANDNTRAGSKKSSGHYMTIVRGTEVAGQTNSQSNPEHPKGHSWGDQSCKNVDTGANRVYLKDEIKHGTVVVRAHDHNNQEIYRATLQPHINPEGEHAYAVDSEYGLKHPSFTMHAHDVAKRLSGKFKGGSTHSAIFDKHEDVYNDNGQAQILHPATPVEHLHGIVDKDVSPRYSILAVKHPNADKALLDKAMQKGNSRINAAVMENPNVGHEHLHQGIDSGNFNVQRAASRSANLKSDHIDKLLNIGDGELVLNMVKHPNFSAEHTNRVINSGDESAIHSVLSSRHINAGHLDKVMAMNKPSLLRKVAEHPRATPTHIDKLLDFPDGDVVIRAASNKNASDANLHKALEEGEPLVQRAAAENEGASKTFLYHALQHPDRSVRRIAAANPAGGHEIINKALEHPDALTRAGAMNNPNITHAQLEKGLSDFSDTDSHRVRAAAIQSDNVTHDQISRALDDPHHDVRAAALTNPKATPEHIGKGLADFRDENSVTVRKAAARHPNITKEHLQKALNDPNARVVFSAENNPKHKEYFGLKH